MQVGVQLPEVERRVPWTEYADMAVAAEAGGFDSVWVGDHLLYDLADGTSRGPWECWSLLAAVAAVTERVQLGPLVAATSFHAPAMLAKKAATVDEISGGRLILGLGAGWNEREYRAYGFPHDQRVSRFEEAFTIIRQLVRDGQSSFAGSFHQVEECVLDPPARPDLPLLVGSSGPRMLRITVPYVNMWNIWFADYDNDPARLTPWMDRVDAAATAAARPPSEVVRTAALLVQLGEQPLRRNSHNPVVGAAAIPAALHGLQLAGVGHAQLVLDPVTLESIELAATAVERWRREQ